MTDTQKEKKSFLIWNMIGQGWQIMKKNVWQLLGLQVVLVLLLVLLDALVDLVLPKVNFPILNSLSAFIISQCFAIGVLTLSLQFADAVEVKFTDFFSKLHTILIYFFATVLAGIATCLGLILFIVPGLIIGARFSLVGYLIIDKNMGIFEALKASWNLVKGVTGRMIGFWLASSLVIFLGLLVLGVGLLFAFPTTSIASALVYRKLVKELETA